MKLIRNVAEGSRKMFIFKKIDTPSLWSLKRRPSRIVSFESFLRRFSVARFVEHDEADPPSAFSSDKT